MKTEVKNFEKIACMLATVVIIAVLHATAFSEFEAVQPGYEDSVVSSGRKKYIRRRVPAFYNFIG